MPPPYTDAEQAAAMQVARDYKLSTRWNERAPGWIAFNADDAAVDRGRAYVDPVDALIAASTALQAAKDAALEQRIRRLYRALNRGTYTVLARVITVTDPDGTTRQDNEWRVILASDRTVAAGPYPTLVRALVEVARLVGEPTE